MAVITEGAGGVRDQQSQTSPKQAVQKESVITQIAPMASQGLKVMQSVFDNNAEKEANVGLSTFRANQEKFLEIAKQFPSRKSEAITRMNSNLSSYIAQNPHLIGELEKIDNTLRTKVGLGKEVFQETAEEAANKADMTEGIKLGLIDPDASSEVQQTQMGKLRVMQGKLHNAKVMNAEYAEEKLKYEKMNDKSSAEAAVMANEVKKKQIRFYNKFAETTVESLDAFEVASSRIIDKYNAGGYDETTAKIAINKLFATATAEAQALKAMGGDRGDIDALLSPIMTMKDTYLSAIGKEWAANEVTKELGIQKARAQLNVIADDPRVIKIAAISELFGQAFGEVAGAFLPVFDQLNKRYEKMAIQVETPSSGRVGSFSLPDDAPRSVTRKQVQETVKGVDALVKGANTVKTSAGDMEAHSYLDRVFEGVDVYAQGVADPVANKGLLEVIAQKSTGELVSRTGGFNPQTAEKVTLLLEQQFLQPMSRVIADHWKKGFTFKAPPAMSGGMEMPISVARDTDEVRPYKELAKPVFKGGQLTFVGVGSGHKQERMAVMELNNKVRPQLQLMIQASAHAGNDMDYNKAWEQMAPTLFPEMFQFDGITGADNKRNPRSEPKPETAEATVESDYDALEVGTRVQNEDGEVFEYTGGDINSMASYRPVGG